MKKKKNLGKVETLKPVGDHHHQSVDGRFEFRHRDGTVPKVINDLKTGSSGGHSIRCCCHIDLIGHAAVLPPLPARLHMIT